MAEFEPDAESIERAEDVSALLIRGLRVVVRQGSRIAFSRQILSDAKYRAAAAGAPLRDVIHDVGQIASQFAMSHRANAQVLCTRMSDRELVPVSLTAEPWSVFGRGFLIPFRRRAWRDVIKRTASDAQQDLVTTSIGEAEEMMAGNLTSFLSFRFAGLKLWGDRMNWNRHGGRPSPVGTGLEVHVSCRTTGMRLHIAPSYFQTWTFFGSPTTPISNFVLPGRYSFAGDGPMQRRRISDPAVFCIPPTDKPVLTRF